MRVMKAVVLLAGLMVTWSHAEAQNYPSRSVSLIVTSAPGGAADAVARMLATQLSQLWGQQVIIENKPGGNTQIAADYVAKSAPDGHVLLIGPDVTFTVNPHLYQKLSYDPVKSFEPISGLTVLHQALVLHPSVPARNVQELIALAKSKPGELNYGTFGLGSAGHLNMEALQVQAGVKMMPVHYRGAAPAFTDVLAGHIQLMFVSFGSALESWQAGKIKIVGIGRERRLSEYPDLPTIAEGGLPGFEAKSWFGLFAPGGTPRDVVVKINSDVARIFADRTVRETFLARQFMEPITGSPDTYADLIRNDSQRWGEVIREAKIKIE
ncbi:MAG: tripartite tricarboxylate transporter substrate binding protein [Alphaproteobacteria bacterium]|nr:tripartite tricarboxylate transporter substrate binding protein [Alphaproteobacteria bacterium]